MSDELNSANAKRGWWPWGACALIVCVLVSDIIGIASGYWPLRVADVLIVLGAGIASGILLHFGRRHSRGQPVELP